MRMLSSRNRINFYLLVIFCVLCTGLIVLPAVAIPAGTETRISFPTNSGCNNIQPSSDNGWIVWEENCAAQQRILAYNYRTAVQLALPNATLWAQAPKIRGNRVVWYERLGNGNSDIYYTDLNVMPLVAHRLDVPESVKIYPGVDGNLIVWQDSGTGNDILLYNVSSSKLYNLTPDTDVSDQIEPSIAGGRVFWIDYQNGEPDIYYNDTSDWSLHSIPTSVFGGTPAGVSYNYPSADKNSVVWYDDSVPEILYSDLTPLTLATPTSLDGGDTNTKYSPAVCSTFIVWKEQFSSSVSDVILFTGGSKQNVTGPAAVVDLDPDDTPVTITPDSRILWVDKRNGNKDNIYMFTLGPSTTCPVVQFTMDKTQGSKPLTVQFTDTSLNSPSLWYWDFGDGNTSSGSSVSHTYTSNGVFRVHLTAATPYCRNTTLESQVTSISVGIPSVSISANTTEGLFPLSVAFTGTGTNSPNSWSWTFGDGGTSSSQNPVHTYTAGGTYNVNLSATNGAASGVANRTGYINVLNGTQAKSRLNISGIAVSGGQLGFDKARVPSFELIFPNKTLVSQPPSAYGWQNITFLSGDPSGFANSSGSVNGTTSNILFQTSDIRPTMFTGTVGTNLLMNYQFQQGTWNNAGILTTEVWQGESRSDEPDFRAIIHNSSFSTENVAYTMTLIRTGIGTPAAARVNLSISSPWETGTGDIASERNKTFVIAEGYDGSGDKTGMVINTTYVRNDTVNHIEYFLADIPANVTYMNKFALAKLAGSGNPFQLITLTIASYISPPAPEAAPYSPVSSAVDNGPGTGSSKSAAAPVAAVNPVNPELNAQQEAPDPGKTASLYTNANGVITQETDLKSNDNLASLTIGPGILAKDATGNPVSSISIASIPQADIPSLAGGQVSSFAGRAYELGPNGVTFSPSVTLSFTVPQAQWDREYTIRTFDRASASWQDLPGSFDPRTGIVTAEVTHFCCFALFSKAIAQPATPAAINTPVPVMTMQPPVQSPTTAISIFLGMILWVADNAVKNSILIAGVIIICVIGYAGRTVYRRRKES